MPGILLRAFDQPLIIDELNRCDIDKVIGPLFTVLSGQQTTLPYRTDLSDKDSQPYVILPRPKAGAAAHEFAPGPAWRFAVYWQRITRYHRPPPLEPSEATVRDVLRAYGINVGTERPDLIVVDRDLDAVAAVVEVKYIAGDTATVRFREAVDQVVRYGRSYAAHGATGPLLARSLVALSRHAPARIDPAGNAPFSVDFEALRQPHGLDAWAAALVVHP